MDLKLNDDIREYDLGFELDLISADEIQLSWEPNVPGIEESIKHKLLSRSFKKTKTGLLMILDLKNIKTEEEYTVVYPDIRKIEVNGNFSSNYIKYYIYCTNREAKRQKEFDKEKRSSKTSDVYRIIMKKID